MSKFFHPLMFNNINSDDKSNAISFIKKNDRFTQGKEVLSFEKNWSKWLGVKYSTFVNSGSSANLITLRILKEIYGSSKEIIVPTLTWNSDIISVIENGFKPVFVDINLSNLSMNENHVISKINKNTLAVFLTHGMGFNGLSQNFIKYLKSKKIILIEDACESHGTRHKSKKIGTFGLISNFSFYYAHHMSTIEGGMICTNNDKVYQISRMLRGHGLLRESNDEKFKKREIKKYKDLSPEFIFMYKGFNMRNNEISATIGNNQIKRLDQMIIKRKNNLEHFLKNLDEKLFYKNFDIDGNSNYALPVILKSKNFKLRNNLEKLMRNNGIEFRRGNAGGGNQLRQPYLKEYLKKNSLRNYPNVEHVHFFGYYIGNYPELSHLKISKTCRVLNSVKI